ncbi:alpha/beta hydrolase family protein [Streptosporangium roseum]|uniref:alpha/beta hydrolase family protein n=1 Tax=Streptosporangium roseum TaxID=2001 RepID=UPI0004CCF23B|nr:acetylhydrolase [Streptosporangium roseum]
MTRIARGALAALLAAALPISVVATTFAVPAAAERSATVAETRLALPVPTGPNAVGRSTLHLVDKDRRDPWVPKAGARELMVSMFYPARRGSGRAAPYMGTEEARLLLKFQKLDRAVPAEKVSAVRTNARADARPAAGRYPMVVLSPGFTLPRATLTLVAEDLASRGYVVAAVDHAYESSGTAFPGGRMTTCVACERVEDDDRGIDTVATGRAKDVSFVLDELTGRHPAWKHAKMIDRNRIGMAGHSIGGNSAARTMETDRRVRAGVNMDGTFFAPVPVSGLDGRPFMMLGTDSLHQPGGKDKSWDRDWARLDGWKRWLTVADSGHFTFIDLPVLGGQLGLTTPEAPLSGRRSGEITRDYVGAFFDLHLRGIPQPLLDGPSTANPEVEFQNP